MKAHERRTLPEGWEWKRLGDVCEKSEYGYTTSAKSEGTGPLFLRTTDISDGDIHWHSVPFCLEPPSDEERYCLKEGDILISRAGSVGMSVVIRNPPRSIFASYLIRFRPRKELNPLYAGFFLKSNSYWAQLGSKTAGTTIPGVNATNLSNVKIPIPPLPTQRRIVSILEKAEETKKLRAQADELTDRLLKSLFFDMFGDPVKNPKGWETKALVKLCTKIYGGGTPSKSKPEYYIGEIPWITPKDMKQDFIRDGIDHISEKAVRESSTNIIPPNSLLMVIRSGILKRELPLAINTCEITLNQDMKAFVFEKMVINHLFMFYYFKIYQKVLLVKVRSVTADNLEFNEIKKIEVILPPLNLQQKFARIVEKIESMRQSQNQSKQQIEDLFSALMQKAFRGEI